MYGEIVCFLTTDTCANTRTPVQKLILYTLLIAAWYNRAIFQHGDLAVICIHVSYTRKIPIVTLCACVCMCVRLLLQSKQYSWVALSFISGNSTKYCLIWLFSVMLFDQLQKVPQAAKAEILQAWWIYIKKNAVQFLTSAYTRCMRMMNSPACSLQM